MFWSYGQRFKRLAGTTLAELMVTIGIMGIVVAGMFMLFSEGLHVFRANEASSDAQSSTLKTLSSISAEVTSSKPELVKFYSGSPSPTAGDDVSAIVFASPVDPDGIVHYNDQGKVIWQKLVCYYYEPNASDRAKGKLYRKERLIPGGDASVSHLETVLGSSENRPSSFANASNLPVRLLGDSVCGFSVTQFAGLPSGAGGGGGVSPGLPETLRFTLDITLETGDPDNTGPESFYIKISSRVTPKA